MSKRHQHQPPREEDFSLPSPPEALRPRPEAPAQQQDQPRQRQLHRGARLRRPVGDPVEEPMVVNPQHHRRLCQLLWGCVPLWEAWSPCWLKQGDRLCCEITERGEEREHVNWKENVIVNSWDVVNRTWNFNKANLIPNN